MTIIVKTIDPKNWQKTLSDFQKQMSERSQQELEEMYMGSWNNPVCTPSRYTITDKGIDVNEHGFNPAYNMHVSEPDAIPAPDIFYKDKVLEPANR